MSSAQKHKKRSHRSQYRARAFQTGRVSVITPSIHKADSFNLIRLIKNYRRGHIIHPQTGRVVVGEPVMAGGEDQ